MQTFAAMAPDPAIAAGLARSYAAQPAWSRALNGVWAPGPVLPADDRAAQVQAIIGIDSAIRAYMQALGALAADAAVPSATSVAGLKTGLAALQQSEPTLLSTSGVETVTSFVQLAADLAEDGYRSAKLSHVIGEANAPFQQALDVQITIVQRGILPSLAEYAHGYEDAQPNLRTVSPVLRYAVNRLLAADNADAASQIAAGTAYVKALGAIKAAHAALYANRNQVLTAAMLIQIKGPAEDALQAFAALRSGGATTVR